MSGSVRGEIQVNFHFWAVRASALSPSLTPAAMSARAFDPSRPTALSLLLSLWGAAAHDPSATSDARRLLPSGHEPAAMFQTRLAQRSCPDDYLSIPRFPCPMRRNTPKRPWHSVPNWPDHVTGDEMVAAMDNVGVDGRDLHLRLFPWYR